MRDRTSKVQLRRRLRQSRVVRGGHEAGRTAYLEDEEVHGRGDAEYIWDFGGESTVCWAALKHIISIRDLSEVQVCHLEAYEGLDC